MRQTRHIQAATPPGLLTVIEPALRCLECGDEIWLEPAERMEGAGVRCPHCGHQALVVRELDESSGGLEWSLINPETDESGEDE